MASPASHLALHTGAKSTPRHAPFDVKSLKRLPLPAPRLDAKGRSVTNQVTYWDSSTKGFGLRLSSAGSKTWIWAGRIPKHGVRTFVRYHLGLYGEQEDGGGLTLALARRKAHEYQQAADRGDDPGQHVQEEKSAALTRSARTFRTIAEQFLATHHPKKKSKLRPSSLRRYTGLLLGPDIEGWRDRPLASLTRADVIDLLHRMQKRGVTVSANRMLGALRKFFHWSIQKNLLEHAPTDHIEPPAAEQPRDRHLFGNRRHNRPSELALLWKAVERIGPFGALPKILMLTGQRLNEVAGMRQEELLELEGNDPRWLIPGSRTKNGKTHLLPLGPLAVEIIRAMPRVVNSPFVFSGTGETGFSGFSGLKRRIDAEIAGLKQTHPAQYKGQYSEPWRFHDLRRTFKTGLAELGIGADIRDALVNHTPQGVAAHYDHAEYGPAKREAMLRWEKNLKALIAASNKDKHAEATTL